MWCLPARTCPSVDLDCAVAQVTQNLRTSCLSGVPTRQRDAAVRQ